jgi:hypothetical protein
MLVELVVQLVFRLFLELAVYAQPVASNHAQFCFPLPRKPFHLLQLLPVAFYCLQFACVDDLPVFCLQLTDKYVQLSQN